MPNYILRNVPAEIWDRFRARARADRWPLRALFLAFIREYGDRALTPSAAPPPLDHDEAADDDR